MSEAETSPVLAADEAEERSVSSDQLDKGLLSASPQSHCRGASTPGGIGNPARVSYGVPGTRNPRPELGVSESPEPSGTELGMVSPEPLFHRRSSS